ncbi:MAG TPA: metallophosphoesterase family protein, partial [Tepidiformaceae bacterium]|nr:metallophosphoesterase family protein [Tepidiformaceae bacterium]
MRIGLIADTHIAEAGVKELWPEIFAAFEGVDLILHAGDIMLPRILDDLERIAPVLAALGNHDQGLETDPRVEHHHVLEREGHTVALVHQFEWSDGPGAFNHDDPEGHL